MAVTLTITPIAAQINNSGTDSTNLPSAPTYPSVATAGLETSTTTGFTFDGQRAALIRQGTGYTVPRIEGGGWDVASLDTTGGLLYFNLRIAVATSLDTITNGGVRLAIRSGPGNWRRWIVGGSNTALSSYLHASVNGYFPVVIDPTSAGSYTDDGTFDPAAVDRVEFHYSRITSGNYTTLIDECFFAKDITLTGGSIGTPAKVQEIADLFNPISGTYKSLFFLGIANAFYYSYTPITITADWLDDTFGMYFAGESAPSLHYSTATQGLNFTAGTGATAILRRSSISSLYNFFLSFSISSTATTVTLRDNNFDGSGVTTIDADAVFNGGGFFGRDAFSLNGATFNGTRFSGNETITMTGGETLADAIFESTIDAGDSIVLFTGTEGDYSALTARFDTAIFDLNGGGGNYDFTGFVGGTLTVDALDGNTYNVAVGSALNAEAADPVTSGILTLVAPSDATVFSGFPTANNANGVAPAPVIGFYDADFAYIDGLDTGDTEYSAGTFAVLLSDYAGVAYVVGDAIGWVRTDFIPVDASNPPGAVSLAAAFREIVDEEGDALVGLGTTEGKAKLTYDQEETLFEVASGPIDFSSALDKKEDLTSNLLGLANFNTSVVRGIQFISNKYGNEILLPSPLTISANATALTSPILTNFLVIRAGDPTADPFEHGLASDAVGLDTRPEIRVNSTKFIAASEGGDATAANQTTIINALAVVDGIVDEILVDTAEIGAAGAGLTEAGGTGDHLSAIPTIANVTTVGTVTDKAGYSLTTPPLDATETQAAAAAALNAYDPPTRAELTSDLDEIKGADFDHERDTLRRIYRDTLKRPFVGGDE